MAELDTVPDFFSKRVEERKEERTKYVRAGIGLCCSFLVVLVIAIIWPGFKAKANLRKLFEKMPEYAQNTKELDAMLDAAHYGALKAASGAKARGKKIALSFNEPVYVQKVFDSMYAQAAGRGRLDLYRTVQTLHTLLAALSKDISPPPKEPQMTAMKNAASAASQKTKTIYLNIGDGVPQPTPLPKPAKYNVMLPVPQKSEIMNIRFAAGVKPGQMQIAKPGNLVSLYTANPDSMEPGCYSVAHGVKLTSLNSGKSGSFDAAVEVDFMQPEGSQVYLRVVDKNIGHVFCLGAPEPGYASLAGYIKQETMEQCECSTQTSPPAKSATSVLRPISDSGIAERDNARRQRSKSDLPAAAAKEETQSERVRRNLGVDQREDYRRRLAQAERANRAYEKQVRRMMQGQTPVPVIKALPRN